ncbi:Tata-box-binding protein, partial [Globisporangium splendens]
MTRTSAHECGDDGCDEDAPWTTERLSEHGVTLRIVYVHPLVNASTRHLLMYLTVVFCAAPSTSSSSRCKCGTQTTRRGYVQAIAAAYMLIAFASLIEGALCAGTQGFNALVIRFQTPKASLLVYRSGKKLSYPSDLSKFTIANVVGSADLGFKVRLEGLAREHSRFCTYEPELFPGLIYRVVKPKCTLLVFVSGKIIITGYKTREEGEDVLCKMFPVLLQYQIRMESFDSDDSDDSDGVL